MNSEQKLEALQLCPALTAADDEELARLAEVAAPVAMAPGDLVFDAGDESSEVYVVVSGALRARLSEDGKLVSLFEAGALFGEYAMFLGGVRAARVSAVEPSVALVIDAEAFRQFLLRCPSASLELLQTAVRRLSRAERQHRWT